MRTMFGRIAAYTAIATLLSFTAAIASEGERPATPRAEVKEPEKQPTAQQSRMKTCNVEAAKKELKGEERRAFMSSCLRTH